MSARILIVEDNQEDKEAIEKYLKVWEYELVFVSSGEDALKVIENQKIDAVLLDVVLPGLDGFEVCSRLKGNEKTKLLPVIMLTSLEKDYRLLAINLGADEFLIKPIDKVELSVRLKSLLRIKSLQDQLEENYKKLEELLKLKDYLSVTVSHDINNLLFVIRGFFEIMSTEKEELPDPIKERLKIVREASDDLLSLISDFVDVKKLEENKLELHPEKTDLNELIRLKTEEMVFVAKDAGIKLSKQDINEALFCEIDKRLISRVLINLIVNGIKSTPAGGNIEVGAVVAGNDLKVWIKDTGVGIPPEYKEKIFEKFVSLDNKEIGSKRGKGIGLTFCRFAVEAHGGKIWVESEVDKGSEFIFTLPRSKA